MYTNFKLKYLLAFCIVLALVFSNSCGVDDPVGVGLGDPGDLIAIRLPGRPAAGTPEHLLLYLDQRLAALHERLNTLTDDPVQALEISLLLRGDVGQCLLLGQRDRPRLG